MWGEAGEEATENEIAGIPFQNRVEQGSQKFTGIAIVAKTYCYRPAIIACFEDPIPEKRLYLYTYKAVTILLLYCNYSYGYTI